MPQKLTAVARKCLDAAAESRERDPRCKLGIVHAAGPQHITGSIHFRVDKELAKFPWLTPVSVGMFGGKFDPAALRFPDSLLTSLPASPLHNAPVSDVRDWAAIRAWATNLGVTLQPSAA